MLDSGKGPELLQKAVDALLMAVAASSKPAVLWTMNYQRHISSSTDTMTAGSEHALSVPPSSMDLAFDDTILDNVKSVWRKIVGEGGGEFLVFQDRESYDDDE